MARAEHASIASFARFCLDLVRVGAPPELVRDAWAAAADEVRHAELARELAARYGGEELRFGALEVSGAVDRGPGEPLERMVLACIEEGCVGETLAALRLREAAERCASPALAAALRGVADDEARHAGLAWRFVQWALRQRPGLAAVIAAGFERSAPRPGPGARTSSDASELAAHGVLEASARVELERAAVEELLRPCARALLSNA